MVNSETMKEVVFLNVWLAYDGNITKTQMGEVLLDSVELGKEGKEYMLHLSGCHWEYNKEKDETEIIYSIEEDEEWMKEVYNCNFDLNSDDLSNLDISSLFIFGDYKVKPKYAELNYVVDREDILKKSSSYSYERKVDEIGLQKIKLNLKRLESINYGNNI
jgi:hypothetical protein